MERKCSKANMYTIIRVCYMYYLCCLVTFSSFLDVKSGHSYYMGPKQENPAGLKDLFIG